VDWGEQYVARSPGDLQAEDVQKVNVLTKIHEKLKEDLFAKCML
jgi:hypothetical protein